MQRLLPLRPRLPARVRRPGALRRHRRPPPGLARGPRLRRQAGRGHRQRRHRHHARPVAGRRRPATSPCSSARPPTSPRCPAKDPLADAVRRCLPGAVVRPGHPLVQGPHHPGVVPAEPAPSRASMKRRCGARCVARAPRGLRHRHPLHARATTRGTSASASCPTATCSRRSGGARRRWSPTTSTRFTETGIRLRVRRRARRPTSSSPPPAWSCCSSAASSCTSTARRSTSPSELTYKGMMLEGVPNLALAFGYTNASWTLEVRPHLRVRRPAAQPPPRTGHAPVHPGERRRARSPREPLLGPQRRATCSAPPTRFPKQGTEFPWQVHQSYLRDYRALKRSDLRRRGHGVLQPVPDAARRRTDAVAASA